MNIKNNLIRFGPSGNSRSFYDGGYKHTYEAPKWLYEMGLNAFEYSFGRGVSINEDTAGKIREEAEKYDIALSAHAPYYINLVQDSEDKLEKNRSYFMESFAAASCLGAKRLVFHPGSTRLNRHADLELAKKNLKMILAMKDEAGYDDINICPETMGKIKQLGDLDEVMELCLVDERIIPAIDFGHLHTRGLGAIKDKNDYIKILDTMEDMIGHERVQDMHIHFSKIEYTNAGEKRHVTFADEGFGPDFLPLADLLYERQLTPIVICESKGTMAEDALIMKNMFESASKL